MSSEDLPSDYYHHARREMVAFVPPRAQRVLDVGCGNGTFGALLKHQHPGIEVWRVEPVAEAAALADSQANDLRFQQFAIVAHSAP